jgi:hypothetical protein
MRASLNQHFDVVVVIWVLTLLFSFSLVSISKSNLTQDQWSSAPQSGPVWDYPTSATGQ